MDARKDESESCGGAGTQPHVSPGCSSSVVEQLVQALQQQMALMAQLVQQQGTLIALLADPDAAEPSSQAPVDIEGNPIQVMK